MANRLPERMADSFPDKKRIADTHKRLKSAGVKYITSCWIDLLGLPKTKPVPLAEFEAICTGKGPQFAVHSVSMVPELGPSDSDQIPIPDLDSLVICPWNKEVAWVFADLWWEDKPYNVCPRSALKRTIQNAADAGYKVMAGVEPEFIVMRYTADGRPVKAIDDDPEPGSGGLRPRRQAFGYDVEYANDSIGFLGEMMDILDELGWQIHDVVTEGAYSQFELDFHYTDMLTMADRLTFLRVLLKQVAKKHGMFVTFMPKPTTGDWRSGAHINHSIQSIKKPGVNLLGDNKHGWSDITYKVLGGVMKHAGALTAIACSTVNSYKGLVARVGGMEGGTVTWAPTHVTYGPNNRSAMLRLPQSRFAIENRAADMCMNAYLAMAMTTAASVEGITKKLDAGKPFDLDLYSMTEDQIEKKGIQRLPSNLLEAIRAFDKDPLAKEVLGPTMHKSFSRYKHDEWHRYGTTITDWEVNEYLRFY